MSIGTKECYDNYQNYCKNIIQSDNKSLFNNFKVHKNFQYMLEHDNLYMFASSWLNLIDNLIVKLNANLFINNIIDKEKHIIQLIKCNEKYGNSIQNFKYNNLNCNANTIKYIYMSLLLLDFIINSKNFIENKKINIIEIGGGYGGMCLIFSEIINILQSNNIPNLTNDTNIHYKNFNYEISYSLIDIDYVIDLQKKYINLYLSDKNHNSNIKYNFYNFNNLDNFITEANADAKYILFSSYSLSEIMSENRNIYYNKLFRYINNGLIFWNTPNIDLDKNNFNILTQEEYPKTGYYNKIIYLTRINSP